MVQAWLEDLRGNDNDLPLVLTPPVMKLEAKKQGKFRLVVLRGGLRRTESPHTGYRCRKYRQKPAVQISW
jgi:P pilus assembly chaperone PapD